MWINYLSISGANDDKKQFHWWLGLANKQIEKDK